jgi:hypothetical protein
MNIWGKNRRETCFYVIHFFLCILLVSVTWQFVRELHFFYVVRTVHFRMKLYNDQHNVQVFNLFIYLLLPYMFRAFFKPIFRGRCTNSAVVLVSWVWCKCLGQDGTVPFWPGHWHHTQQTRTTAEFVHLPLKMGLKKGRNI